MKELHDSHVSTSRKGFNKVYFIVLSATNDIRMFKSDGTSLGTVIIAPVGSTQTNPMADCDQLIMHDSTLFFRCRI